MTGGVGYNFVPAIRCHMHHYTTARPALLHSPPIKFRASGPEHSTPGVVVCSTTLKELKRTKHKPILTINPATSHLRVCKAGPRLRNHMLQGKTSCRLLDAICIIIPLQGLPCYNRLTKVFSTVSKPYVTQVELSTCQDASYDVQLQVGFFADNSMLFADQHIAPVPAGFQAEPPQHEIPSRRTYSMTWINTLHS